MTFKEFKKAIFEISREEFQSSCMHPLDHGIDRANFEEQKLKRLIAMGHKARFQTAKRRVESWERQLERLRGRRQRLENTKAGIFETASRPRQNSASFSWIKKLQPELSER